MLLTYTNKITLEAILIYTIYSLKMRLRVHYLKTEDSLSTLYSIFYTLRIITIETINYLSLAYVSFYTTP